MIVLAILVLIICIIVALSALVWLALDDLEALLLTLGVLVLVIIFSGALTWALTTLGLVK